MAVYNPLFVYLTPASIPQVVAHIQQYLADNPIVSDPESIAEAIQEYIEAHPEIIAVASVNGKTGNVVLTGSDININASSAVSLETQLLNLASMISAAGSDITQINAQLETIYTNIGTLETNVSNNSDAISALQTSVEGQGTRLATAESDIDALQSAQSAQNTRLNTAEGNISSLQTRMNQAETDIDNNESSIETLSGAVNTLSGNVSNIGTKLGAINGAYHVGWGTSVSFSLKSGQHALVIESSIFYTVWRSGSGLVTNYYVNTSGGTTRVSDMKNIVLNGDTCTVSSKSGENSTFNVIVIG